MQNYLTHDLAEDGVSLILCCFNSVERLPSTLRSLARQHLPGGLSCELIVVDNNSSDNTAEDALKLWNVYGNPFPITVVSEPLQGLAFARRAGVLVASYSIGIFCDDDNWPCQSYVSNAFAYFKRLPSVGLIGGSSLPVFDSEPPPWIYSKAGFYAIGDQGTFEGDITDRKYLWGACLAFRVAPLLSVFRSGVNPLLSDRCGSTLSSGGDSEICAWFILMGWRMHWYSNLFFYHYIPSSRLTLSYLHRLLETGSDAQLSAYHACLTLCCGIGLGSRGHSLLSRLYTLVYASLVFIANIRESMLVLRLRCRLRRLLLGHSLGNLGFNAHGR